MDEIFFECFREADDPNRVERAFADTVMDDLPGRRICLVLLDFEIENLQALHPSRFNAPDRGVNELLVHEIVTGLSITTVGKADLKYPRQLCRKFSGYCKAVHATLARRGTRRYDSSVPSRGRRTQADDHRRSLRRGSSPRVSLGLASTELKSTARTTVDAFRPRGPSECRRPRNRSFPRRGSGPSQDNRRPSA